MASFTYLFLLLSYSCNLGKENFVVKRYINSFKKFIYFGYSGVSLLCGLLSSCSSGGYCLVVVHGLLSVGASLVLKHTGYEFLKLIVVACGLSKDVAPGL